MGSGLRDALAALPLLAGLPSELLDAPDLRWHRRRVKPGQIVIEREAEDREVLFLLDGTLMAVYWTEDGRELVFSRIGPGAYVGEIGALDEGPRSVSVYAQSAAEVIALEQASFLWLLDRSADLRHRVICDLATRVRQLTERMAALLTQNVEQRVRGYLARLALEAGQFRAGGVIEGAPTHAEIANTVGANREAVSRAISVLTKSGVIESARRKVRILRPDDLEAGP